MWLKVAKEETVSHWHIYDTILSDIKCYRGRRGEHPTEVRMITAYILSLIGKKLLQWSVGEFLKILLFEVLWANSLTFKKIE